MTGGSKFKDVKILSFCNLDLISGTLCLFVLSFYKIDEPLAISLENNLFFQ